MSVQSGIRGHIVQRSVKAPHIENISLYLKTNSATAKKVEASRPTTATTHDGRQNQLINVQVLDTV